MEIYAIEKALKDLRFLINGVVSKEFTPERKKMFMKNYNDALVEMYHAKLELLEIESLRNELKDLRNSYKDLAKRNVKF